MGTVYEAIDQRLDTTVALKETFFADERLRKQFEREARLLARLHHPALPRVSDHFSEGEGQFLVMQFIPGDDLSEMMVRRQGPFPAEQVLTWADQLLDALDYLHTQDPQIVHRDIKPQNLKLTSRGQIILLDFGLAKGQSGEVSRVTTAASIWIHTNYAHLNNSRPGRRFTQRSVFTGSDYLSPAHGNKTTGCTDSRPHWSMVSLIHCFQLPI
jgi:serine/threonine protein kinase